MKSKPQSTIFITIIIATLLFACAPQSEKTVPVTPAENQSENPATVDVEFTLQTIAENGKLLYIGRGGDIDGLVNPDLAVESGSVVHIVLTNGDGMVHDLFLPDFNLKTEYVKKINDRTEMVFEVGVIQPGPYVYYCTLPGHRKAGQEGNLIVESSN